MQKLRAYLINGVFVIRSNQQSLKYLLELKLSTPLQQKYLAKLMDFTYTIEYKKGLENKAADALSRRDEPAKIQQITVLQPMWVTKVISSYEQDSEAQEIIAGCTMRSYDVSLYAYEDGLLKYKGKIYIGQSKELRLQVIQFMHSSNVGGHSGVQGTLQKIQQVFLWPGLREQVKEVVSQCQVCQVRKHENVKSPGLLQPLHIPNQAWVSISMDFIDQLPNSHGKTMIWVVVDRFTKYGHFVTLDHPISASSLAQVFLDSIYKLHGLPSYIVSDRDTIFTSTFWRELMNILGVQ